MENKNLFDVGKQIENEINFIEKRNQKIIAIELNQYTLDYLRHYNIYGFTNYDTKIDTIINNNLMNFQLDFHIEQMQDSTPYIPYNIKEN